MDIQLGARSPTRDATKTCPRAGDRELGWKGQLLTAEEVTAYTRLVQRLRQAIERDLGLLKELNCTTVAARSGIT
jgi:hypothetical protein